MTPLKSQGPLGLRNVLAWAFVIAVLISPLGTAETVVDGTLGFSIALPEGFVRNQELLRASPDIVHAFMLGEPNGDKPAIVLLIENMRGTLRPERMKPASLPANFKGGMFTLPWQGFEVDVVEVPEELGQIRTITYNVQIPLKKSAIQLKLVGVAERKPELNTLLRQILAGLKGESNWIASAAPGSALARSPHYGTILLVVAGVIVLTGLVAFWWLSRKTPKGTVLALAVALYAITFALGGIRVREMLVLSGSLRMLGFAGIILGIIDVVRKRPQPAQGPPPIPAQPPSST